MSDPNRLNSIVHYVPPQKIIKQEDITVGKFLTIVFALFLFFLFNVIWWLMWGFILIDFNWIERLASDHSDPAILGRFAYVIFQMLSALVAFGISYDSFWPKNKA